MFEGVFGADASIGVAPTTAELGVDVEEEGVGCVGNGDDDADGDSVERGWPMAEGGCGRTGFETTLLDGINACCGMRLCPGCTNVCPTGIPCSLTNITG